MRGRPIKFSVVPQVLSIRRCGEMNREDSLYVRRKQPGTRAKTSKKGTKELISLKGNGKDAPGDSREATPRGDRVPRM